MKFPIRRRLKVHGTEHVSSIKSLLFSNRRLNVFELSRIKKLVSQQVSRKPIFWNENPIITIATKKKTNVQNILGTEHICSINV
jgi:hypothetical protein